MIRASKWVECVIAKAGTLSAVCNLGKAYEYALIQVPTVDTATVTVRVSRTLTGTGVDLYLVDGDGSNAKVIMDSGTGNFMWAVSIYGAQYLWFYTDAAQSTAAVTFYVRGFNGAVRTN